MSNFIKTFTFITLCLFLIPVFAFAQTPPGVDITLDSLLNTAKSVAGWLIMAGGILAGITIIATGIMYLTSGGNPQKMTGAKNMFKAGIIGALIIFSPGIIINTVGGFASNPFGFFGGGGGTPTGTGGGATPTPDATIVFGCSSNNTCDPVAGGIFGDSSCAGQCGGAGGQAVGSACSACVNQGSAYCLADSNCYPNALSCPGVFTTVPGGCP